MAHTALYEVNLRWPVKANDRGAILTTGEAIAQFAESYAKSATLKLAEEAERAAADEESKGFRDLAVAWDIAAAWLREKARL